MFHSNHGPISYRLRYKERLHLKIPFDALTPTLNRFPLELGIGAWSHQKIRIMVLSGWERTLMLSSAVWIQHMNVIDRWTDKQTDGHRTTTKTVCLRTESCNKHPSQCLQLCNSVKTELRLYQRKNIYQGDWGYSSAMDSGHNRLYHQAEPVT